MTYHRIVLPLVAAGAIVVASACADPSTASDSAIRPRAAAFDVVEDAGADLSTVTTQAEAENCPGWVSCRDLDTSEISEIGNVLYYLDNHPDWECRITGLQLHSMLQAKRIKVGTAPVAKLGSTIYEVATGNAEIIVIKSTVASSMFENRHVLLHERFHARGYVSTAGFPSQRKYENESIYEPSANAHHEACRTY